MQTTLYTIYRTTNLINQKIYIGKHQTDNLDDGYLGSGKYLKRSMDKHGIENFQKEILFVFDNEEEMNAKEAELVNKDFVLQESNYNICVGGQGGWSYVNSNIWTAQSRLEHNKSISPFVDHHTYGIKGGITTQAKRRNAGLPAFPNISVNGFAEKTHTSESKEKMSGTRPKSSGKNNSQFGTAWITNGIDNKKIRKDALIPEGWRKGRST